MAKYEHGRLEHTRLGHYRLLERIGSGGMGTIYEAEMRGTDRHVAVKVLGLLLYLGVAAGVGALIITGYLRIWALPEKLLGN